MGISPLTDERITAYCMASQPPSRLILNIPLLFLYFLMRPTDTIIPKLKFFMARFMMFFVVRQSALFFGRISPPSRYHSIRILSSLYQLSPVADFPILSQSKPLVSK